MLLCAGFALVTVLHYVTVAAAVVVVAVVVVVVVVVVVDALAVSTMIDAALVGAETQPLQQSASLGTPKESDAPTNAMKGRLRSG